MLRKSKAFVCTQGGEPRFSPLRILHRVISAGVTGNYLIFISVQDKFGVGDQLAELNQLMLHDCR